MSAMMQMLTQQRIDQLHREAAYSRLIRQARTAHVKPAKTPRRGLRRRPIVVAG